MTREQAKKIALKCCRPFLPHSFERWIFPAIRNVPVHDNLLEQLVSVQPMSQPDGAAFYMDFVYDSWWNRFKRWLRNLFRYQSRVRTCRRLGRT